MFVCYGRFLSWKNRQTSYRVRKEGVEELVLDFMVYQSRNMYLLMESELPLNC